MAAFFPSTDYARDATLANAVAALLLEGTGEDTATILDAIRTRLVQDGGRLGVRADHVGDQLGSKTLTAVTNTATGPDPIGTAGAGELVLAVRPGDGTMMIRYTATGAGNTIQFECSLDGGTTWDSVMLGRIDGGNASGSTSTTSGSTTWGGVFPPGTTHVRARLSVLGGTAPLIRLATRQGQAVAAVSQSTQWTVTLANSANMIGGTRATGVWYDDTATPLGASGTFTGSVRDLFGAASGSLITTATGNQQGNKEIRALAVSDVAGDLCLEVSRDNINWRRILDVPASNAGTGGLYVAQISHAPATRFTRFVYVNGATAQTQFMLQSLLQSA